MMSWSWPRPLPCCRSSAGGDRCRPAVLSGLMADSYRTPLWAAAYVINGGCSDDGFDYFRGWLIVQGRQVFERAVADPDALADLAVIPPAPGRASLECESVLYIPAKAHRPRQVRSSQPTHTRLGPECQPADGTSTSMIGWR